MKMCDDCGRLDIPQWTCSVTGQPIKPGDRACGGFRKKPIRKFISNVPPKQTDFAEQITEAQDTFRMIQDIYCD